METSAQQGPQESPPVHDWEGATVKCTCGSFDVKYIEDRDHDMGTCEVFKCQSCGKRIHIEMPD